MININIPPVCKSKIAWLLKWVLKTFFQFYGLSHHRYFGKRIDRSDLYKKAIIRAGTLSSSQDRKSTIGYLKKKIRRLGGYFSGLSDDWWEMLINVAKERKSLNENDDNLLIKETLSHNANILCYEDWIDLYALTLRVGLFHAGSILRDKAKESILKDTRETQIIQRYKLGAAIDNGDWEYAEEILNNKPPFDRKSDIYKHAVWIISNFRQIEQFNGDKSSLKLENNTNIVDSRFLEFIKGKSVAIVGPVTPLVNAGKEIDSFDFIVKFNHRIKGQGCDPLTQGKKIDASYYNGTQADILIDEQNGIAPDDLKVAIFNSFVPTQISGPKLIRSFNNINTLLFNGNLNAVPNAVYDIILHQPKIIKIFCADLMLSNNRYKSYRPSKIGKINYTRSCVTHDPLTQFNMLRHAWLYGLIIGDPRFEAIMSMGGKEYMHQLQILWSVTT